VSNALAAMVVEDGSLEPIAAMCLAYAARNPAFLATGGQSRSAMASGDCSVQDRRTAAPHQLAAAADASGRAG